jgi:ferredoxin
MKVIIDGNACTGHGRCYTLSPDVFDSHHEGHSVVKVDALDDELLRSADVAVSNDPERAISLEKG